MFYVVAYIAILAGVLVVVGVDTTRATALIILSSIWMAVSYFANTRFDRSRKGEQTVDLTHPLTLAEENLREEFIDSWARKLDQARKEPDQPKEESS